MSAAAGGRTAATADATATEAAGAPGTAATTTARRAPVGAVPVGGRLGFGPGQERGGFGEQAPRAAGLPAACWDVRGLVKGHGHRGWHQRQAEGRGEGLVVGSDSFWGLLCLGFAGWKLFSL